MALDIENVQTKIEITDIQSINDFEKFVNSYFTSLGVATLVNDIKQIPYRAENPEYLRFLAMILSMVADFGYNSIYALVKEQMKKEIKDISSKDYLDPRNLVHLAGYFAELLSQIVLFRQQKLRAYSDDFAKFFSDDLEDVEIQALEDLKAIGMSRIMSEYVHPAKGTTIIGNTTFAFESRRDLPHGFIHDFRFNQAVKDIPEYELKEIHVFTEKGYFDTYLSGIINAFRGIDCETIFKVEFENNP